jgi:monovalent cation/proton antiporter MnhG/PhaG subunit
VSAQPVIAYVLLGGGVSLELVAALGLVAMRDVYDRLHYLGPATLGALLIAAAVWVYQGPSQIALEAMLVAAIVLIISPALAHATARAARISEHGDWRPQPDERIEVEEP